MSTSDLLRKIFSSYKARDDEAFFEAAMEIIADEKRKNHHVLAKDLQKILENGKQVKRDSVAVTEFQKLPKDKERNFNLVEVKLPNKYLPDIIVTDSLKVQISLILEEYNSKEILYTYGLMPKRKLLFSGPPGCGKTLCAEIIAGELGLPLLYARFDSVISSYLGETSANLRKVFDFASSSNWVVFFDEFDAIGKSRLSIEEHGELKRVVNTFLQLLDNFESDSIFIAATNHDELLDDALWRRFDDILLFDKPDQSQIYQLIMSKLRGFRHKRLNIDKFVVEMAGWSHADIERTCLEAVKISVLADKDEISDTTFAKAMERQNNRLKVINR